MKKMRAIVSLLAALMIAAPMSLTAQETERDSADFVDEMIEEMLVDFDVTVDSDSIKRARRRSFQATRKPRLMLSYGQATFSRIGLGGETHGMTMYGASVGMDQSRPLMNDASIIKIKNDGIFVHVGRSGSMATIDTSFDEVPLAMHSSMNTLSFGGVDESGYGYMIGDHSSLRFLVTDQSTWTSVSPQTYASSQGPDQWQQIRDFTGTLRFGSTMAPTIEWKMGSILSLRASYNWTQVLPRHMFWYWAGSEIIEGVADGIAGAMVKAFGRTSPASLPVMNFILRNAVAFGFKELRRDKMNWPFETAAPLNVTSWNVGLSVTF